jgi:hypothetical protein
MANWIRHVDIVARDGKCWATTRNEYLGRLLEREVSDHVDRLTFENKTIDVEYPNAAFKLAPCRDDTPAPPAATTANEYNRPPMVSTGGRRSRSTRKGSRKSRKGRKGSRKH